MATDSSQRIIPRLAQKNGEFKHKKTKSRHRYQESTDEEYEDKSTDSGSESSSGSEQSDIESYGSDTTSSFKSEVEAKKDDVVVVEASKNSTKQMMIIFAVIVVLIIIAIVSYYFYKEKQKNRNNNTVQVPNSRPPQQQAQQQAQPEQQPGKPILKQPADGEKTEKKDSSVHVKYADETPKTTGGVSTEIQKPLQDIQAKNVDERVNMWAEGKFTKNNEIDDKLVGIVEQRSTTNASISSSIIENLPNIQSATEVVSTDSLFETPAIVTDGTNVLHALDMIEKAKNEIEEDGIAESVDSADGGHIETCQVIKKIDGKVCGQRITKDRPCKWHKTRGK